MKQHKTFGEALRAARENSRWPSRPDFCYQTGLGHNSLEDYEYGKKIPGRKVLERILARSFFSPQTCNELQALWDKEKAKEVGIALEVKSKMPTDVLARKLQNEVSFILKQARIPVSTGLRSVVEKRFIMILRNALGE